MLGSAQGGGNCDKGCSGNVHRHLRRAGYSLARLQLRDAPLLVAIVQHTTGRMSESPPEALAGLAVGLALGGQRPSQVSGLPAWPGLSMLTAVHVTVWVALVWPPAPPLAFESIARRFPTLLGPSRSGCGSGVWRALQLWAHLMPRSLPTRPSPSPPGARHPVTCGLRAGHRHYGNAGGRAAHVPHLH
jgi:hypothetical protein